jgi:hypothetical protein
MKFYGVVVGIVLALLAEKASADFCYIQQEPGPKTCNCSDEPEPKTLCTSAVVQLAAEKRASLTGVLPGFTALTSVSFNETVPLGDCVCVDTTLEPHTCCWLVYQFQVCNKYTKVEGFWSYHWVVDVTVTYLGVSLTPPSPAGAGDC